MAAISSRPQCVNVCDPDQYALMFNLEITLVFDVFGKSISTHFAPEVQDAIQVLPSSCVNNSKYKRKKKPFDFWSLDS